MTRKRVVSHPGLAWVVAIVGAWLAAASCRTMQGAALPSSSAPVAVGPVAGVPEPSMRVGVLVEGDGVSIDADSGVVVRGQPPGETASLLRTLPRATFGPGRSGRVLLVETGDQFEGATVHPMAGGEILRADATAYRGLLEVRPAEVGKLTVVNVVNLEDYLRGVVPNELSPEAFPRIEALKAQAVAARTYALSHLRSYSSKGFDVCATPACQVYRGQGSEHPLTDRAVQETAGIIVSWRGRPINAYYTSTCGGHTEEGGAIFDDDEPYLKGVACRPERSSGHVVGTTAAPRLDLPGGPETARDVALLAALGVIDAGEAEPARLEGIPADAEVRAWTIRLKEALPRPGCESPVAGALARRASFARHLVSSMCRTEKAGRLLPAGDGERQALAFLAQEGLFRSRPGEPPSPDAALTRAEAFSLLAGALEKEGAPGLAHGELAGSAPGELSVLHGEAADSHPVDPGVRLFRDHGGVHAAASELTLSVGDRLVYVERGGRVVYLEAEESGRGDIAPSGSRYYRWEARMSLDDVARAIRRYGSVGRVRDIVPKRLGVSGRVIELAVVGSEGQLDLKGLQVRWGLGLRENLFVVKRERSPRGDIERFVITGKGWGHGVGLCQVGAFGMAQAGSTFEEILKHYYTGVRVGLAPFFDTRRAAS